jgi:hypothetical protein
MVSDVPFPPQNGQASSVVVWGLSVIASFLPFDWRIETPAPANSHATIADRISTVLLRFRDFAIFARKAADQFAHRNSLRVTPQDFREGLGWRRLGFTHARLFLFNAGVGIRDPNRL